MARYQLLTRMFVNGRIHEAGETVDVPDDWTPPMRAVAQPAVKQANAIEVENEPLAVKVEEPEADPAPVERTESEPEPQGHSPEPGDGQE